MSIAQTMQAATPLLTKDARQHRQELAAPAGTSVVHRGLEVSAVPGTMTVNLAEGAGEVIGTEVAGQGAYPYVQVGDQTVAITAADPTNPRIDLVVIKVTDAAYAGPTDTNVPFAVTGTPDPSPADPTLPDNVVELARVLVPAGATDSATFTYTDLRDFGGAVGALTVNRVVNVPADYATLQSAINAEAARYKPAKSANIEIRMAAGFAPTAGVVVADGDFSHFTITSVDATVAVAGGFTGVFLSGDNARMPTLDCLVNMGGNGSHGVHANNNSTVKVTPNNGVTFAGGDGLRVENGSTAKAEFGVFDNATGYGIQVWFASTLSAEFVSATNSGTGEGLACSRVSRAMVRGGTFTNSGGLAGVYASQGSIINAGETDCSFATVHGYRCTGGSIINANDSVATDVGSSGIFCERGGWVIARTIDLRRAGANAINAVGGSTVYADLADLSAAGTDAIGVDTGSTVVAKSATLSTAGNFAVNAVGGSTVVVDNATATGCGSSALFVRNSTVSAVAANLSGNVAGATLRAEYGANVMARGADISNSPGIAVFAASGAKVSVVSANVANSASNSIYASQAEVVCSSATVEAVAGNDVQCLLGSTIRANGLVHASAGVLAYNLAINTVNASGIIFA